MSLFCAKFGIYSFIAYIVFSDRCTLKNITLNSGKHYVVNRYNLFTSVQQNIAKVGTQLSPEEIDIIFGKLYPLTQIDEVGKMMHIKNIQQNIQNSFSTTIPTVEVAPNAEKTICPRCGGKLVERIASKGNRRGKRFLGCSNYPKCRYIENLSDEVGRSKDFDL